MIFPRFPCYSFLMPYGTSPHSRYRWRADREPDTIYSGLFSPATEDRYYDMLGIGLLEVAILYWPVTLGLLALSCLGLGLGHLLSRAEARGRARALAADARRRRALRRRRMSSVFPPPSPEALLAAWERSRDSLSERILLGSLMADLEPAVDASYQRDADGSIVGRAPGIRGWLAENAPELLPHYKALMSYKRLAERFRLACGLDEPGTAEELLAIHAPDRPAPARARRAALAKPRREAAALLAALPRPTLRALDDELHRRLGLVRRHRGPRRRRTA